MSEQNPDSFGEPQQQQPPPVKTAAIDPVTFRWFDLNDDEYKAAKTIHPVNQLYLHNLRTAAGREILNSVPASSKYEDLIEFQMQRAYLKGKFDQLDELLGD